MKHSVTPARQLCLKRAQLSLHSLRHRVITNVLILAAAILVPRPAHASLFQGEQLDFVANVLSWVVLIVVPIVVLVVFWIIHILPEKIAEKRHHPQAKAIQCLCLLSLVFGGLLWPIAWLWAYSKPVLHKMAYGTDVGESHGHSAADTSAHGDGAEETAQSALTGETEPDTHEHSDTHISRHKDKDLAAMSDETARLRARIAELKAVLSNKGGEG